MLALLLAVEFVLQEGPVAFGISKKHGHIAWARLGGRKVLLHCLDEYWVEVDDERFRKSCEVEDEVLSSRREGEKLVLLCRNRWLGVEVVKTYWTEVLSGEGSLLKRVEVRRFEGEGVLHIFSNVALAPRFAERAWLYAPRHSWRRPKSLYGVRRMSEVKEEIISGSGWDNRFVVAFLPGRSLAVAHWREKVDGRWVPPSCRMVRYGWKSPCALAYLPKGWRYRDFAGGWRFRLLHTTRAEGGPSSGTARYVLFKGDWYDAWRLYKATDGFAKAYEQEIPLWVRKVKYGTFWGPPLYEGPAKTVKRLCQKLGDAYLTIGVFGWSLDGDYETERPFITETMYLVMTPEYFARCVKALQSDPRAKVGLYVQGTLIDSYSDAFRNHPEWALTDREGRPLDSNMADNPVGRLFIFNPRNDGWVRHFLSRIKALLLKYDPGWLYNDGGAVFEGMDWRTGLPVKVTHWLDITRRMLEVVRSTGPERALLLNAENFPYGDMYWLECPYFSPTIPWRETVDYCFDTEFLHDPRRTMLPLYWRDEDRYLAMCISFGFTPCGPLTDVFSPKVWRAIEAAWAMRPGELVARSDATSPVWWRDGVPVVTFAEKVKGTIVVPVLNFGEEERVEVKVNLGAVGLDEGKPVRARIYRPLLSAGFEELGYVKPRRGVLSLEVSVPKGWRGLTLLIFGEENPFAKGG